MPVGVFASRKIDVLIVCPRNSLESCCHTSDCSAVNLAVGHPPYKSGWNAQTMSTESRRAVSLVYNVHEIHPCLRIVNQHVLSRWPVAQGTRTGADAVDGVGEVEVVIELNGGKGEISTIHRIEQREAEEDRQHVPMHLVNYIRFLYRRLHKVLGCCCKTPSQADLAGDPVQQHVCGSYGANLGI